MSIASEILEVSGPRAQSRKLHVLFVVDQLPRSLGGGERAMLRMISGLSADRFRCALLVLAPFDHDLDELPADVHVYPLTSAYNFRALKYARKLIHFIRSNRVDIVVTFFESSDLWAGTIAKCFTSAKVVWSKRDLGILRGPKHRIAYRALRWVPNRVIAVSEQVRRYCIGEDGIPAEKTATIYNGTQIPELNPSQREATRQRFEVPQDATWVVCTANVRRVKGLDVLIEAVHLLAPKHSKAVFTVMGGVNEPEHMAELQLAIKRAQLESIVRFVGESRQVSEILAAADLFVLPSRSEGFSNALIEAMAAGLPSVATDVGGNAEALQHGETGLLVPVEDVNALACALDTLLSNPDRCRKMGRAARIDAEQRFSNEKMLRNLSDVLEQVHATRSRS